MYVTITLNSSIIICFIDEYNILLIKKLTLFITTLVFLNLIFILLGLNFYFFSFQLVFSLH